jgi:hypothetical protein
MFDTISNVRLLFMQQDIFQKKRRSADFIFHIEDPPPEAVPPCGFWIDRTLSAQFDHWSEFRRTFTSFTTLAPRKRAEGIGK